MIKSKKPTKQSLNRGPVQETEPQSQAPKPFFLLAVIAIVVIAAAVLMFTNGLGKKKDSIQTKQNGQNQEMKAESAGLENDIDKLISRISELITIKQDEDPTVATVQDADLLRTGNPEFYKEAENGDRLLVWSDKAVLYSVKKDKLLAVMQIQGAETDQNQNSTTTGATTSEDLMAQFNREAAVIDVKNGTRTAGIAGRMKTDLTGKGININSVGDATLKNYEKTIIVKNTTKAMPATEQVLISMTGATVQEVPEGEIAVTGDYTIIVGANFLQ